MPTTININAKDLNQEALNRKTGEKMVYVPLFNYETYSNQEGWKAKGM